MTLEQIDKAIKNNVKEIENLNRQNKELFVMREKQREKENGQISIFEEV